MTYPQPGQYPAYPQYPVSAPAPKPPVPDTVRTAFTLMLLGAALEIVGVIVTATQLSSIENAIAANDPNLTPSQLQTARDIGVGAAFVGAAIGMGLWIWMAFANRAGHNWARITGTVFFGINTLSVLVALSGAGTTGKAETAAGKIVAAIGWLIGLATVILLWNKKSGAYFKPPLMPGYGYGNPYPYPAPGQGYPAPGPQQPYGTPPPDGQPQDPWNLPPQQ